MGGAAFSLQQLSGNENVKPYGLDMVGESNSKITIGITANHVIPIKMAEIRNVWWGCQVKCVSSNDSRLLSATMNECILATHIPDARI